LAIIDPAPASAFPVGFILSATVNLATARIDTNCAGDLRAQWLEPTPSSDHIALGGVVRAGSDRRSDGAIFYQASMTPAVRDAFFSVVLHLRAISWDADGIADQLRPKLQPDFKYAPASRPS
jgi:hypothetical protein